MNFLSLVAVLALLYWVGSIKTSQYDGWFKLLSQRLQKIPGLASVPALPLLLSLAIPLAVLVIVFLFVQKAFGRPWLFFIYFPVLLYSLGRGNVLEDIKHYLELVAKDDNVAATQWLGLNGKKSYADEEIGDWKSLHTLALKMFAYRGYENTFAVIFWFVIAGPFGALLYRMSLMYRDFADDNHYKIAAQWLWLLELPSVRLMGITWALVGNFETCPLRENMLDIEKSSATVLNETLRGALGAPTLASTRNLDQLSPEARAAAEENLQVETQDIIEDLTGDVITIHSEPAYSLALVKSCLPLYKRSLLFWVCAIAFATLFV